MDTVLIIAAVIAGLFVLDRVLLFLEARGWIYWRKRARGGSGGGNAMLQFNIFANPAARHLQDARDMEQLPVEEPIDRNVGSVDPRG